MYATEDISITAHRIMTEINHGDDGTINPRNGLFPTHTKGHYVGGVAWTMVVNRPHLTSQLIENYILMNLDRLGYSHHYVGYWTHNGKVYLDVSDYWTDLQDAKQVGRERCEIAVWSIHGEMSVPV